MTEELADARNGLLRVGGGLLAKLAEVALNDGVAVLGNLLGSKCGGVKSLLRGSRSGHIESAKNEKGGRAD